MPNILVTGGAGYIGSLLTEALLNDGHKVCVVDNFSFSQTSLNHLISNSNFSVIKGDVRDKDLMKPLYGFSDIIIPLAALVGAPICKADPVGARTINHDAINDMLAAISPSQNILMPTTNSAYGKGTLGNYCDETTPLNPISQYAIDKVEVEEKLMQHPNAISFRLATVFGFSPRMRTDLLVNDFTLKAVRDGFVGLFEGHFKRNYIHVRDVCKVFQHGIANFSHMKGNIFNVGLSEANLSKIELCQRIQEQIPNFIFHEEATGSDPDQRDYLVSNEKIEGTGFKPQFSIDFGISELVKGYATFKHHYHGNI